MTCMCQVCHQKIGYRPWIESFVCCCWYYLYLLHTQPPFYARYASLHISCTPTTFIYLRVIMDHHFNYFLSLFLLCLGFDDGCTWRFLERDLRRTLLLQMHWSKVDYLINLKPITSSDLRSSLITTGTITDPYDIWCSPHYVWYWNTPFSGAKYANTFSWRIQCKSKETCLPTWEFGTYMAVGII